MGEMHCSEHLAKSANEAKAFYSYLVTTLFLNAINSYFINLIHFGHKLYWSILLIPVWKNTDERGPCKMDEQLLLIQDC